MRATAGWRCSPVTAERRNAAVAAMGSSYIKQPNVGARHARDRRVAVFPVIAELRSAAVAAVGSSYIKQRV